MHGRVSGSVLLAAMACGATVLGGCDDRSYGYQPPAPVPSMGRAACIPDPLTVPSTGADAPTIRIFGDAVVELPLGQPYADPGATAESTVDGDLGARILTRGLEGWDMGRVGDHLITYTVSSLDGTATSHASRLVRITDGQSYARQTARSLDATRAPFGYLEHLPVAYSAAGAPAFPLIIFNHGIGEAYDWDDQDADEFGRSPLLLDRLLRRGLPALLRTGEWDDGLPFIVLSPQRCSLDANRSVQ